MKTFMFYLLKTFKDIVKSKAILSSLLLSVLFYSFFYPSAYQAQQAASLPIVIVDEEHSDLTAQIIQTIRQSPNLEVTTVTGNFAEAEMMVKQEQADAILLLPYNLSNSLARGEVGGIGLYLSSAYFIKTSQIGKGLALSIEQSLANHLEKFSHATAFEPQLSIHSIPLFNVLSGYGSYVFPAIAALIIHQTILLSMGMLIAGYRQHAWRPTATEFWACFSAIFIIGCLGCFYLFGFTFWLYDYPHGGNFWGMLLAVPIYISCVIGLGFVFGSYLDMPERSGHVIVFSSVPIFLLSGSAWPHAAMPAWLQWIGEVLPSTQAIQMFLQLNQMGVPTLLVIPKLIYLASLGAILLLWGYYRLRYSRITAKQE